MKKALIIIPIVIVVAAATVLGLFAAGVIGKKAEEPVAYAVEANKSEVGVFKNLSEDTFFDIRADRDPTNSLDNYVIIRDNKGNKVPIKVSERLGGGVYRVTARDGFKPRASYQIWATGATFQADQYKDLDTFIFMIKGPEADTVTVNPAIKETELAGTTVQIIENNGEYFYNIALAAPAAERYQEGDVILAKKPAQETFNEELGVIYNGDIPDYQYNGMAAYYVLRESEVKDGREEVYCRLAAVNEVVTELDINKTLTIDENNFSVNEAMLQDALEKSDFTAAVYEAAVEAYDLVGGHLEKTVKDSPKMVAKFDYEVNTDKIELNFYFIITLAKDMDIVFAVKNTIDITPNVNCDLDVGLSDFDLQLDLGVNIKTNTVCSIDMETSDAKMQATSMEDFKQKFSDLVKGKTSEKGIVGAELPIYSYKYPIYCFVLGIEFGVDLDLGLKAQIDFEYVYNTDITAGVTYVNGEINSYKNIETSQSAKDLVLLGKIRAEAGVYLKLTGSLLEVAGVGFKVKTGAYAEIGGQIRLDMQAALEDKTLHVIKGYYVTGGLYLGLGFEVKAGITFPVIGWKGWQKSWTPARWDFPLFEYGSKYLVQSLVDDSMTVDIQGRTAEFNQVKVNAFDLYSVEEKSHMDVPLDSFDIEYLDGAENYITLKDGLVTVNPAVGTEFNAVIKLTAKSDNYVTGTVTFHKAAVMPTCEVTELSFDKRNPQDVTFDVKINQSRFIRLTGEDITENFREVASTGAVTLSKAFLSGLDVGAHTFTYVTDKGRVYLTVNVIDSTPITANKTASTFLKSAKANVNFSLTLSGSRVTEIEGLKKGEYSVDSAGTLVIYALALRDKEPGDYDYRVVASNGTSLVLTVTVRDDRVPALYASSFAFGKNQGVRNDVEVSFESYEYTLKSVEGNSIQKANYAIRAGSVAIGQSFLATLDQGVYNFTLRFDNGTDEALRVISVKVLDTASIVAGLSAATFDKCHPADAEYKIYASASVTVTGNGLTSAAYSVSGSTVKIKKEFLANLNIGDYTFTAHAGSMSTELTLSVIDTTVPEIEAAEGGVLTIEYDKALSGDRFFEMLLSGASFDKLDGNGVAEGYTVSANKDKGTTKVTLLASYLNALRVGTYEYSVLTSVNVSTLIVRVTDTRKPEPETETSLSYTLGANSDLIINIHNYEHEIKGISVKNGGDLSIYNGDCDFDAATGVFVIKAQYLETLAVNTYVTLFLTFDEGTVITATIAVS